MRALESGTWLFGTATLASLALGAASKNPKTKSLLYVLATGTSIGAITMYLSDKQRMDDIAAAARSPLSLPVGIPLPAPGLPPAASVPRATGSDFISTSVGIKRPNRPPLPPTPAPLPTAPSTTAPTPAPRLSCGELQDRWQRAAAAGQRTPIVNRLKQLHAECCADLYQRWQTAIAMGQSPAITARLKSMYDQQCASARA